MLAIGATLLFGCGSSDNDANRDRSVDFTTTRMWTTPSRPFPGETIELRATIANQGYDSADCPWRLYRQGRLAASGWTGRIAGGNQVTLVVTITEGDAGYVDYQLDLDPNQVVPESYRTNDGRDVGERNNVEFLTILVELPSGVV
jgi:hypothetical protein